MTGDRNGMDPAGTVGVAETVKRAFAAIRAVAGRRAHRMASLSEPDEGAPPDLGGSTRDRDWLGVEDLRRAALAAADLDDPAIMDNAWR